MKSNNELNDLYDYGYYIYQNSDYFKFSLDSVLLAEFVDLKKNQTSILDMCAGNVPVSMILEKKYGNKIKITAVELQKEIYELGIESIKYNSITNINLINENVSNLPNLYNSCFDIVVCNPPYFKVSNKQLINDNEIKAIARHELTIDLEGIIVSASKCIKNKGYFYIVHRPERVADVISLLNKYNFGVKTLQFIYDSVGSKCSVVLIESIYNGENYVKVNNPIYLKEHSTYKNIFGK